MPYICFPGIWMFLIFPCNCTLYLHIFYFHSPFSCMCSDSQTHPDLSSEPQIPSSFFVCVFSPTNIWNLTCLQMHGSYIIPKHSVIVFSILDNFKRSCKLKTLESSFLLFSSYFLINQHFLLISAASYFLIVSVNRESVFLFINTPR